MFVVNPRVEGVTPELVELYREVCSSTIGHTTEFGFALGLQPLTRPIHFAGNAVTVRIPHLDSTAVHVVLDLLKPGDVLVIDTCGDRRHACFGGGVGFAANVKKIAGVVLDGCITDYQELKALGLPIYSRPVSPITTRILGKEGEINVPVTICGVTVNPGDLVLADDDGVFFTDAEKAWDLGKTALEKQTKEPAMLQKVAAGMSLAEISGAIQYTR